MADQEYDNERRPVQNRSNATIAMQSNPSYSASNNADNTTNLLNKSQTYCQSDGAYVIEDITSTVPPPYSTRQQEAIPQGRANSRQVHYAENAPNEEYYTALDMDGTSVFYERLQIGDTHSANRGAPILPLPRSHGQPPPGTANSQPSIREQPAVVRHPQVSIAHDRQMNSTIETTSLPKYALVIGVVTTIVFSTVLFWLPGLVCLIPAIGLAIAVSV